jgi:hypothetical protein
VIVNLRVRPEFPEPARGKECFGVRDHPYSDSLAPDSCTVCRFGDKTPSASTAQHFVNHFGVFSRGFIRPKSDPHFHPDRPVVRAHLSDGEYHAGDRTMGRGLKVGDPTHAGSSGRAADLSQNIGLVSQGEKQWKKETRVGGNILSVG